MEYRRVKDQVNPMSRLATAKGLKPGEEFIRFNAPLRFRSLLYLIRDSFCSIVFSRVRNLLGIGTWAVDFCNCRAE